LVLLAAGLLVPAAGAIPPQYTVLVFTRANAGRHVAATDAAVAAIRQLGRQHDFFVNVSTNPFNQFTDESLERYRAVIFLPVQPATIVTADRVHPSSAVLPERWTVTDQWYNFATSVRGASHVLATVNEATYAGGTMGFDHPIAWCKNFQGGRSWYSGLGHTAATFANPDFAGTCCAASSGRREGWPATAAPRCWPTTSGPRSTPSPTWASRWVWPSFPMAACCTTPATASSGSTTRQPA
jgi:hypothetical protein